MPSLDINSPTASYSPVVTFTTTQFEREVLIQSLICYIDTWRSKQRNIVSYVPETPFAITVAGELLEKLRS